MLQVRHYPFDSQRCTLTWASWAYDGKKIDLLLSSSLGDQSNYMISTEWNLRKIRLMILKHFFYDICLFRAEKNSIIYSCCPEPYPFVGKPSLFISSFARFFSMCIYIVKKQCFQFERNLNMRRNKL